MHSACARVIYRKFKRGKSLFELFFYKMFSKCSKWPHGKPKLIVWTEKKHPKSSFKVYLKWKLNEQLEKEPPEMMPRAALVDMFP